MGFLDDQGLQKTLTHINTVVGDVRNQLSNASNTVLQEETISDDIDKPILLKYGDATDGSEINTTTYDQSLTYNPSNGGTLKTNEINVNTIKDNGRTLTIKNDNTTNTSNDFICIESTNGQVDIRSKNGVNILDNNGRISTITANLTGNADTSSVADKLSTTVLINGWNFDGTSSIMYCNNCITAASTAIKQVQWSNNISHRDENIPGTKLTVHFSYGNTASNPKLKFHSHPEAPIYYNGAALTSDYFWGDDAVIDFVFYDDVWNIVGGVDSDKKVAQTNTYSNSNYPLLFTYNTSPTSGSSYGTRYYSNILLNPSKKYLAGITTISPYIDGSSEGCSNNDMIYSNSSSAINIHGTIIETGLRTNIGTGNSSSKYDYVCIGEIFLVGNAPGYSNMAVMFQIAARDEEYQNRVHVKFTYPGSGSAQPTTATVKYELPWSHEIYLVKPVNSPGNDRWHLVVHQKSAYDNIDLLKVSIPAYLKNVVKVIPTNNQYWTPDDWKELNATKIAASII